MNHQKRHKIQNKALEDEGDKFFGLDKVIYKWKSDFEKLHKPDCINFDVEHYETIIRGKELLKDQLEEDSWIENEILTKGISLDEVKRTVEDAKKYKIVGIDKIFNEALKHLNTIRLLYTFFKFCFIKHLLCNAWLKTIIFPIPKLVDSNQCTPLKYEGISLFICIYKIYTNSLNRRIG